jgi:P-type Ca2+ transporter type 2B
MAKQLGLRTLAFAYRDYPDDEWATLREQNNNFLLETDRHEALESELTFLAAFGLQDELREGA